MKARAPFQPAPTTMPIAAISSSAWTMATFFLPVAGSTPIAAGEALERLGDRGRGRDRIPGADRRAAVERAERGGVIALDQDPVADRLAAPDAEAERAGEAALRVLVAEAQRAAVGLDQLVLALEPLGDQLLEHGEVDVEQRGERADIDHVAVELALARLGIVRRADFGQRHADDRDVAAGHGRAAAGGSNRRRDSRRARAPRRPGRRSAGSSPPACRRRRARAEPAALAHPAPRTRSAGPGCWRGRCCAARSARPCAGSTCANRRLALAEPEPLTLAKRITKSLVASIGMIAPLGRYRWRISACPTRRSDSGRRTGRSAGRGPRP